MGPQYGQLKRPVRYSRHCFGLKRMATLKPGALQEAIYAKRRMHFTRTFRARMFSKTQEGYRGLTAEFVTSLPIHMHIHIHICIYTYIYAYLHIHACLYIHAYIYTYIHISIFTKIHMYIYIYVFFIHTRTRSLRCCPVWAYRFST